MIKTRKGFTILALALTVSANGLSVGAQEPQKKVVREVRVAQEQDILIERGVPGLPRVPLTPGAVEMTRHGDNNFVFVSSEMSFDGKVVKNAPYSAQAVTETVHTLADGNRIVRKNTAQVYRDGEGRTRRDQTLGAIGPFASAGDPPQTFFINDPVAGVNYILDPRSKTARKLPRIEFATKFRSATNGKEPFVFKFEDKDKAMKEKEAIGQAKVRVQAKAKDGKDVEMHDFVFTHPAPHAGAGAPGMHVFNHSAKMDSKTEKLDNRNVNGVDAEGTRTTTTIAAGEIGNEQPIVITSERWYSPELQTIVMTRHSDPRFGETTYQLTNINRSEPSPSLFQLPSDYTVKEGGPMFRTMRPTKKANEN